MATTKEQIEIVDTNGNPVNADGTAAYPRTYDMEDFLPPGMGAGSGGSAVPPVTSETLANADLNLIQLTQSMNPLPPAYVSDPTSSFLDKFANLWSTSKLFDVAVIGTLAGAILYGVLHNSGSSSSTSTKPAIQVPVLSSAAASAARAQVANALQEQTQVLQQMGYSDAQIQTPRDMLQFSQDSAISLNSAGPSVSNSPTGKLAVIGSYAPNHYSPLHALNTSNYFATLSKSPNAYQRLANSAALHGDTVVADSH